MKFTEDQLKIYAKPLSDTENEKCKQAIMAIRDALKSLGYTDDQAPIGLLESDTYAYAVTLRGQYSSAKVRIFIQGSYANNTCVSGESDVDIAVVREDIFEYAFGTSFNPTSFDKRKEGKEFKDSVENALKKYFPYCVHRKNKSIKVDGSYYRKQADAVPCFSMHYYNRSDQKNYTDYMDGITIYADDGTVISNFPKQHIINGNIKNNSTNYYYKKMVRIIKKMRCVMDDCGCRSVNNVSSFGLESLLWNIPNGIFTKYTIYRYGFGEIVDYLYNNQAEIFAYKEANGIKPLCPFQEDIVKYNYFISDLKLFYEYDI